MNILEQLDAILDQLEVYKKHLDGKLKSLPNLKLKNHDHIKNLS